MDNTADVILDGKGKYYLFACSVSTAGDINNDGYDDVVVDTNGYNSFEGKAYVCSDSSTATDIMKVDLVVPQELSLSQNYPNPFNPTTRISYSISKSDFVSLKIYDMLGLEIQTLVNETQSPKTYNTSFNASDFRNGVYFYKLQVGIQFIKTKKMLYLK